MNTERKANNKNRHIHPPQLPTRDPDIVVIRDDFKITVFIKILNNHLEQERLWLWWHKEVSKSSP